MEEMSFWLLYGRNTLIRFWQLKSTKFLYPFEPLSTYPYGSPTNIILLFSGKSQERGEIVSKRNILRSMDRDSLSISRQYIKTLSIDTYLNNKPEILFGKHNFNFTQRVSTKHHYLTCKVLM